MPPSRGRGSRGRGGTAYGARPLKGLFTLGRWHCDCDPRLPAILETVKKEGPTKGKRFWKCQNWNNKSPEVTTCNLFIWEEEASSRAEAALLNNSRAEPRPHGETNSRPPPRPNQPSVTPTPSYDFRAPNPRAPSYTSTVATNPTSGFEDGDETEDDFEEAMVKVELDAQNIAATTERLGADIVAPVTPRANRAEHMVTPGKRKHSEIGLETPQSYRQPQLGLQDSGYGGGETLDRQASKRRAIDSEFLDHISPQSSPTPARYRNAEDTAIENTLFKDISDALTPHGVRLSERSNYSIQQVCTRYERKTQGLVKGREISRLALTAREAKIAELQLRIRTLNAELDTERAIVKLLREAGDDDQR